MSKFDRFHLVVAVTVFGLPSPAYPDAANSVLFNEGNSVSGSRYLANSNSDTTFGRVEGNGQNWFELLVVKGDDVAGGGFKNTLDMRGWTIDWKYDKSGEVSLGTGQIKLTDDPLWSAVPRGTLITVSEWSDIWYERALDTATNGHKRAGGMNGVGTQKGVPFDSALHYKVGTAPDSSPEADPHILATDTNWNPGAGDWRIHLFAGEPGPNDTTKYFTFTGSVTKGTDTFQIGTDGGGLFTINNDRWEFTSRVRQLSEQPIEDVSIVQNRIGEDAPGNDFNLGADEVLKLEAWPQTPIPTLEEYLGIQIGSYGSGTSSTFGLLNTWSSGASSQNVDKLRDWIVVGDADLDGAVTATDYVIWRKHDGGSGGWRDGDFSGDGLVDAVDYELWRGNFGGPTPGAAASTGLQSVPEPVTALAMLTATFLLSVASCRCRASTSASVKNAAQFAGC